MFNIDMLYKSATPMKLNSSTNAWLKKLKIPHPPSCTLDAVVFFVPAITIPLQGTR